jgi:predicted transcriptional regulator
VLTIPAATPLPQVAALWFGEGQQHRAFPVIDEQGAFVCMVDRQSIVEAEHGALCAGDLVRDDTAAVALPDETCRLAAQRLATQGLERMPVVADLASRRLVGIISRSDLVKPAQAMHEEEGVRERMAL